MLSSNGNLGIHIKSLDCTCWSCYWILFYLPNQMLVDFGKYNGHFKGKVGSPGLVSESSRARALFWSEPARAWARLLQTLFQTSFWWITKARRALLQPDG